MVRLLEMQKGLLHIVRQPHIDWFRFLLGEARHTPSLTNLPKIMQFQFRHLHC